MGDFPNDLGGGDVREEEGGYKCSKCEAVYTHKSSLDRHMKNTHETPQQRFKCPISNCDKIFAQREYRRTHVKYVHKVNPDLVLPPSGQSKKPPTSLRRSDRKKGKPEVAKASEPVLCILCCYSFYPEEKESSLESNQFQKFAEEILKNGGHPLSEQLSVLESFSVCPDCLRLAGAALGRKLEVENGKLKIKRLEQELIEEKRKLGRRLAEYSGDMKKIEEVVSLSDVACLEGYLKENQGSGMTRGQKKVDPSVVVLRLRNGIISAASQMDKQTEEAPPSPKTMKVPIRGASDAASSAESQPVALNEVVKTGQDLYSDPIDIKVDPEQITPNRHILTSVETESIEQLLPENSEDDDTSEQEEDQNPSGHPIYAGIDTTHWTNFKKKLLKWTQRRSQGAPRNNNFRYNADLDKFTVGDIQVVIHEEAEFIECSQCSFHVIEGTLPDNQSVAEIMQQHIQTEHLSQLASNLEQGEQNISHPLGGDSTKVHSHLAKSFKCNLCGVEITGKINFNRHLTQNHDRPFGCPTCGKRFATSKNLRQHLLTHSDQRRFACRKGCGFTFKHGKNIAKHERRCQGKMTKNMAVKWRMLKENQKSPS